MPTNERILGEIGANIITAGEGIPWGILVIDDDEEDFILVKSMIKDIWKDCVDIRWHPVPKSAVEIVCSGKYHVSLIDSHFFTTTGIELIEQIQQKCPGTPILFLCDWPDPQIMEEAIQKGASDAIFKRDFSGDRLTEKIKNIVIDNSYPI